MTFRPCSRPSGVRHRDRGTRASARRTCAKPRKSWCVSGGRRRRAASSRPSEPSSASPAVGTLPHATSRFAERNLGDMRTIEDVHANHGALLDSPILPGVRWGEMPNRGQPGLPTQVHHESWTYYATDFRFNDYVAHKRMLRGVLPGTGRRVGGVGHQLDSDQRREYSRR